MIQSIAGTTVTLGAPTLGAGERKEGSSEDLRIEAAVEVEA